MLVGDGRRHKERWLPGGGVELGCPTTRECQGTLWGAARLLELASDRNGMVDSRDEPFGSRGVTPPRRCGASVRRQRQTVEVEFRSADALCLGQANIRRRAWHIYLVAVTIVVLVSCSTTGEPRASTSPSTEPSIEYKLATINGDLSSEGEFQTILDRLQAGGGNCNPEPDREHVADIIVAGWQEGGKKEPLVEFARALMTACG